VVGGGFADGDGGGVGVIVCIDLDVLCGSIG
jgi:hypothetical protein